MRNLLVALLAAASVSVYAAEAQAVAPQKGATLIGTIKASPFDMTVTINVSQGGTISSLSYVCGTGRAPTKVYNLPVDSNGPLRLRKQAQGLEAARSLCYADDGIRLPELGRMRRREGVDDTAPQGQQHSSGCRVDGGREASAGLHVDRHDQVVALPYDGDHQRELERSDLLLLLFVRNGPCADERVTTSRSTPPATSRTKASSRTGKSSAISSRQRPRSSR